MPVVRRFRRVAPLLVLALLLVGCETEGPRSTLHPVGYVAEQQLDLLIWTTWLSVGVVALVAGVLGYAIFRFRSRYTGDKDAIPNQVHGSVPLEITWTLIPVIIVILVAVPTVRTIFETEVRVQPQESDVLVHVTGYQWWWKFEYPELGIVTANELHVPVGTRVVLDLDSADVLHSFWVPKLAGKRDMIPNQENQLWLIADEEGIYWGHCAELCLGAHAYMRFRVIVESEEEYQAWVESFQEVQVQASQEERQAIQPVQNNELIQEGRTLFAQKGCIGCHSNANFGPGYGSPDFPNLTNFGLRNTVAAGVLENTHENLTAWIRDPQAIKPGNYMPTLWQEDDPDALEEASAIAAYLLSLGIEGEQQAQANAVGGTNGDR
ncbi:MAG TPA: cytochrome c oxidase subunit II [Trueperaceae bacterium]